MGVTTFVPAVGGTSLVCYLLMTRAQNRGTQRCGPAGDNSGSNRSCDFGGDGSLF